MAMVRNERENMNERVPAEGFAPGEFIREELEERGWTQADLAVILGRTVAAVNEIITGKRGITPESARGLAAAFGTTAQYWMNLSSLYQLWLLREREAFGGDEVARRAKLYSKAPIKDMLKRGWIESSSNVDVLEQQVKSFLEIASLDDEPQQLAYAARKATSYCVDTPEQLAWLFRAKHLARIPSARARFSTSLLENVLGQLKSLIASVEEVRCVPRILADAGIRFLVIEHLPHSRIDGACIWLDGSPVIAISFRYDRIDYFWFTLLHELAHVKGEERSIDLDLVGKDAIPRADKPQSEQVADDFAVQFLVPQDKLENFIARKRPFYYKRDIAGFALTINVHPGIVVGQLQHRGELAYSQNREMLVPVRDIVTKVSITDGWGQRLSVSV